MSRPAPFPEARRQAESLERAGDVTGAAALLRRAVEQGRAGLAGGDPELLATMRQLAGVLTRSGDPAASRRLLEEAYEAGALRGADGRLMVLLAYDLALVAEELGNRHEARKNFERVAASGPALLGDGHEAVARARASLDGATPPPPDASPAAPARQFPATPSAPPVRDDPAASPGREGDVFAPVAALGDRPGGRPAGRRRPWILAAAGAGVAVVATALVVVLMRPGGETQVAQAPPAAGDVPAGGVGSAIPELPVPPVTVSLSASESPLPAPSASASASPSASRPRSAPAPARTTPAARPTTKPATATRIVSPADGSQTAWEFPLRLTVSAADAGAKDTVLAPSICVGGRCYIESKLEIAGGAAAARSFRFGSTRGEGVGQQWTVRIDRLSQATYGRLMAERDAEIADGSWGSKGTTISSLNGTPVATTTLTKTG